MWGPPSSLQHELWVCSLRSQSCVRPHPSCVPPSSLLPSSFQLADFGFSKDHDMHSAPTSRVGTPAYLAPEVINSRPGQAYDSQVQPALAPRCADELKTVFG